jgi:predicted nucleotidyltransferase
MRHGAELDEAERSAVVETIARVRREVAAKLEHVLLFGSRARGTARPDSDLDLLLVFRRLPPDREPHAGNAERIAEEVARGTGVPLGVWSVSLEDFSAGVRTPMLVDAAEDGVLLWPDVPPPPAPLTPEDACFGAERLLERVAEGSDEVATRLPEGSPAWNRRVRDDLVRLATALLLLAGETRPRRGDALRCLVERSPRIRWSAAERSAIAWGARAYPRGHVELDDPTPVPPPPVPPDTVLDLVTRLRDEVRRRLVRARRTTAFVRG